MPTWTFSNSQVVPAAPKAKFQNVNLKVFTMHKRTNKCDEHRWSPCQSVFVSVTLDISGMPSQDNPDWKNIKIRVAHFKMHFRHNPNSWVLASAICWLNKHYSETNWFCLHLIPLQPCRIPEYQSIIAAKHPAKGVKILLWRGKWKYANGFDNRKGQANGCHLCPLSLVECEFQAPEH